VADDVRVVRVTLYAAARAAAGTSVVQVSPGPLSEVLAATVAATRPDLGPVLERCSVLVDGLAAHDRELDVQAGSEVDVLPPFAGG
jgi:molybdopterin converting factor small subunit